MKTFFRTVLFGSLMAVCANSYALSESEAEDMADLTAVFVFLKNDCGYQNLPNGQIRRALVFFAQQNQWDLSNYDTFDMKALGEDSYRDLSGIGIPVAKKCKAGPRFLKPACLRQIIPDTFFVEILTVHPRSMLAIMLRPFFYGC